MKKRLSAKTLFILAFIMVAAVNGIVLSSVAYNRSGDPNAVVILSERELNLPYWTPRENSGMALTIAWQTLGMAHEDNYRWYDYRSRNPRWLDETKLRELGFNVDRYKARKRYKPDTPREVFVVLELGGEPWQAFLKELDTALEKRRAAHQAAPNDEDLEKEYARFQERVNEVKTSGSRLFAVDAGTDSKTLRAEYNDRNRFIIAPAIVAMDTFYADDKKEKIVGHLQRLSVERIHVPVGYKQVFATLLSRKRMHSGTPPAFGVEVAYGKRLEPWIRAVTPAPVSSEKDKKP